MSISKDYLSSHSSPSLIQTTQENTQTNLGHSFQKISFPSQLQEVSQELNALSQEVLNHQQAPSSENSTQVTLIKSPHLENDLDEAETGNIEELLRQLALEEEIEKNENLRALEEENLGEVFLSYAEEGKNREELAQVQAEEIQTQISEILVQINEISTQANELSAQEKEISDYIKNEISIHAAELIEQLNNNDLSDLFFLQDGKLVNFPSIQEGTKEDAQKLLELANQGGLVKFQNGLLIAPLQTAQQFKPGMTITVPGFAEPQLIKTIHLLSKDDYVGIHKAFISLAQRSFLSAPLLISPPQTEEKEKEKKISHQKPTEETTRPVPKEVIILNPNLAIKRISTNESKNLKGAIFELEILSTLMQHSKKILEKKQRLERYIKREWEQEDLKLEQNRLEQKRTEYKGASIKAENIQIDRMDHERLKETANGQMEQVIVELSLEIEKFNELVKLLPKDHPQFEKTIENLLETSQRYTRLKEQIEKVFTSLTGTHMSLGLMKTRQIRSPFF